MTDKTPSKPNSSQPETLGFDDLIGILVAFATIGFILFWSLSRKDDAGWNIEGLLPLPTTSASPVAPATPDSTQEPVENAPAIVNEPTEVPSPIENNAIPEDELPPQTQTEIKQLPTSQSHLFSFPDINIPERDYSSTSIIPNTDRLPTIPPPISFTDIPANFWGQRFIDVLSSRGIIKGFPDYTFRPNQPVTRAEFAAILKQAFSANPHRSTEIKFKDIPKTYWANPAISEVTSSGFLRGYPNSTFKPQQKIQRVQVLVALASGLSLNVPPSPEKVLSIYEDSQAIPQYAINKVAAATANGLVVNYPDVKFLTPTKEATRTEVAAMIHQALVRMGRLQPIKSETIVTLPQY